MSLSGLVEDFVKEIAVGDVKGVLCYSQSRCFFAFNTDCFRQHIR